MFSHNTTSQRTPCREGSAQHSLRLRTWRMRQQQNAQEWFQHPMHQPEGSIISPGSRSNRPSGVLISWFFFSFGHNLQDLHQTKFEALVELQGLKQTFVSALEDKQNSRTCTEHKLNCWFRRPLALYCFHTVCSRHFVLKSFGFLFKSPRTSHIFVVVKSLDKFAFHAYPQNIILKPKIFACTFRAFSR